MNVIEISFFIHTYIYFYMYYAIGFVNVQQFYAKMINKGVTYKKYLIEISVQV